MTYIVRSKDRRSNITYAYEVTNYRDKETKKPRSHWRLIGRVNEKGEIVPTDGRMRKKLESARPVSSDEMINKPKDEDAELKSLKKGLKSLLSSQLKNLEEMNHLLQSQIEQNQELMRRIQS